MSKSEKSIVAREKEGRSPKEAKSNGGGGGGGNSGGKKRRNDSVPAVGIGDSLSTVEGSIARG